MRRDDMQYRHKFIKTKRDDIIKGYHPLVEALESGKTIRKIFILSTLQQDQALTIKKLAQKHQVPLQIVPMEKLNRLASGQHQGIIALSSPVEFTSLDSLIPYLYENNEVPLLVVLDSITDVRNFGAIVRSAEFLGVNGVVIPQKGGADINEIAIKASSGAMFRINLCRERSLLHAVRYMKNSGIQVLAASEKGQSDISQTDFTIPTAIVLGSEETGIAAEILNEADAVVSIPGPGQIKSLNVSVAASIFFYEASKQRSVSH